MRCLVIALLLGTAARAGSAQQPTVPLLKTDLIELLSNPVIQNQEVAALVRRNCLAFRPTERDWTDFRNLGASADVVSSIAGCAGRPTSARPAVAPPAAASPTALQVIVRQPRLTAAAGGQARVVVLAARGGIPQPGIALALRGSGAMDGSSGRDLQVATDDSGFAVFTLRVGRRLNTYRLEVAPAPGGTLPGRPVVELAVRPGPPATAAAEPREVLFDQGLDSIVPVTVVVRDSLGYPVAGEPVVLRGREEDGFAPDTAVTDSLGRARVVVERSNTRRGTTLQAHVRGRPLAAVEVLEGLPLAPAGTGFLPVATPSGSVRNGLGEPLVFEARTRLGHPAVGRTVLFRGINAEVTPASGITDSAGRVRLEVTLGERLGSAVVVATIDTLERRSILQVEPGPAVELMLEHNRSRVDGRWLLVALDTTFVIRVRAFDASGHPNALEGLARMVSANRAQFDAKLQVVQLIGVQDEQSAVALTFRSVRAGRTRFKLNVGDLSAEVIMEVVPER